MYHSCFDGFSSYQLLRLSSVSAVFDFSASLKDVAPVSLMLLSVDFMRMEKSGLLTDAIVFLCLYNLDRAG